MTWAECCLVSSDTFGLFVAAYEHDEALYIYAPLFSDLVTLPDLSVVGFGTVGLSALLQLIEASLSTILGLLRVVGVADGGLYVRVSAYSREQRGNG